MRAIGIFGSTGMLGAYVQTYLMARGFKVICFPRNAVIVDQEALVKRLSQDLKEGSWVINCAGVIKPQVATQGFAETIRVNGLFPHVLADASSKLGLRAMHISTDCVFSGSSGHYTESSSHDEQDIYGKSKSLGEPQNCQVVRTSIIGEERQHKRSLIEWAKGQRRVDVKGFMNHYWNGITCLQFAKVAEQIITKENYWNGVRHVFSPSPVTKYELLHLISQAFSLELKIATAETPVGCDRTLATDYPDVNASFSVPSLESQLRDLSSFSWA